MSCCASATATTVTFSLSVLAKHGSKTAPHKDGWGIAYYEGASVRVLRDTRRARGSQWVQFAEQQELHSTPVLS